MEEVSQLDRKQRPPASPQSPLTPELREFIDRAVVPILVREYLASMAIEKQIAEEPEGVASCELMANTPDAEACR